jgi:hypothetical protein
MMVDLLEFLRSGSLGALSVGSSENEIRAALGAPEMVSAQSNPIVWKYRSLELTLSHDSLVGIALYFWKEPVDFPSSVALTGWKPDRTWSIGEFMKSLDLLGITWQTHPLVDDEDWKGFQTQAGVSVYFDVDGSQSSLHSIQLLDPDFSAKKAAERVGELGKIIEGLKKPGAEGAQPPQ